MSLTVVSVTKTLIFTFKLCSIKIVHNKKIMSTITVQITIRNVNKQKIAVVAVP